MKTISSHLKWLSSGFSVRNSSTFLFIILVLISQLLFSLILVIISRVVAGIGNSFTLAIKKINRNVTIIGQLIINEIVLEFYSKSGTFGNVWRWWRAVHELNTQLKKFLLHLNRWRNTVHQWKLALHLFAVYNFWHWYIKCTKRKKKVWLNSFLACFCHSDSSGNTTGIFSHCIVLLLYWAPAAF